MAIIERCTNETINIPSQKQTLTSVAGWKPITGRILWPTTTLIRKCVLIVRASGTDERCSHYTRNYNRSRPMNRACSRRYRNLPLLDQLSLSLNRTLLFLFLNFKLRILELLIYRILFQVLFQRSDSLFLSPF